jgi:hypothetical protein
MKKTIRQIIEEAIAFRNGNFTVRDCTFYLAGYYGEAAKNHECYDAAIVLNTIYEMAKEGKFKDENKSI